MHNEIQIRLKLILIITQNQDFKPYLEISYKF